MGGFAMRAWMMVAIAVWMLGLATEASAQVGGHTKLGLGFNGFTFASYDPSVGDAATDLSIGPFAPSGLGSFFGPPPIGLDIGYGASDAVLVGVVTRLGVTKVDSGGSSGSTLIGVGFLPHVDYVMSPHSSFRPYLGVIGGVTMFDGTALSDDMNATFASIGAQFGGYAFVGSSLSIGPRLVFTYSPGLSSDVEELSVIAVQILIEIAGWL
jgi:hypothetical protein